MDIGALKDRTETYPGRKGQCGDKIDNEPNTARGTGVKLKYILTGKELSMPPAWICRKVQANEHDQFWILGQTFVAVQDAVRRTIYRRNWDIPREWHFRYSG